ncbi:3-hydroxyisobutyrate dehydrogenase-like beta-hydroxyacid dehydrogenase [Paenarthrobacter nitroguajacolicus]|nr:3-hydroxyisobutyrate dehydrogenase-like beta-hydroxyacid dehydrogenase [Paenarthrobacter nitroguajacolicus]
MTTALDMTNLKGAVGVIGDGLLAGQISTRLRDAGVDVHSFMPVASDLSDLVRTRLVLATVSDEELLTLVLNAPFSTGAMAGAVVYVIGPTSPTSVRAATQLAQMHGVRLATAALSMDGPCVLLSTTPPDTASLRRAEPLTLEVVG